MQKITLGARALAFEVLSLAGRLPGRRFGWYGRRLALRNRRAVGKAGPLLWNPVSSVRYFEFDFAARQFAGCALQDVLDVASPMLLGFYLSERQPLQYHYVNRDEREFDWIRASLPRVGVKGRYHAHRGDATALPHLDESFDAAVCISVLEHIPGGGDSAAVQEMWRVLRPGGRLVLTVPVSAAYREEHRSRDVYRLGQDDVEGAFFFQRIYDEAALQERLLDVLPGGEVVAREVFGEKTAGFFQAYEARWATAGAWETVKDPFLMARHMRSFPSIEALPGQGVAGVCLRK